MTTSSPLQIKSTNRTVSGPRFQRQGEKVILEYDYERDDGGTEWIQIVFEDVLDFEYRQDVCCDEEDVIRATEIRSLTQSERLSRVLKLWQERVGWQIWQQKQGGVGRFKHFKLYFDDAGCVDVIAASCQVK